MTDFVGSKRLVICVEGINEDSLFDIIHCAVSVHYAVHDVSAVQNAVRFFVIHIV